MMEIFAHDSERTAFAKALKAFASNATPNDMAASSRRPEPPEFARVHEFLKQLPGQGHGFGYNLTVAFTDLVEEAAQGRHGVKLRPPMGVGVQLKLDGSTRFVFDEPTRAYISFFHGLGLEPELQLRDSKYDGASWGLAIDY